MTVFDDLRAAVSSAEGAFQNANTQIAALQAQVADLQAQLDAAHNPPPPPPPDPTPDPVPVPTGDKKFIGMSAPKGQWSARLAEVGPAKVTSRRIFADLASGGNDQQDLVKAAHDAGMIPLVSYKVGDNISGALSGAYDQAADQAAAALKAFKKPTAVTIWHEPNPDITGQQFLDLHKRLIGKFKDANVKVGPVLNGWLLDKQTSTFKSFLSDEMLKVWDFVGIDTYQSGSEASPGGTLSGDRIAPLIAVLKGMGHASKPLVVGEYNGYDGASLKKSGEVFLSTPTLWIANVFNSNTGGKGIILTGDRLASYKATKADARAAG